jgi:Superfamily II DNA/RNA helicases, SNF2 family
MMLFKTTPWEHQVAALNYLYPRKVAALYTDMGTGKSKIMIDLIGNKPEWDVTLIVCTKKGCQSWVKQIDRHYLNLNEIDVINLTDLSTEKKVVTLKSLKGHEDRPKRTILICNYDSIWREPFATELMKKYVGVDCIICDESHRIKSPSSKCSRYLTKIGKRVECRYLVTGTPLAEDPVDVYAQYRFLDPTIFGTSLSAFRDQYLNINYGLTKNLGYIVLDKKQPYKNLGDLKSKMFSCAFYGKSKVKLPKKHNIIHYYTVDKKTEEMYHELKNDGVVITKDGYISVENVLSMSMRQQQILSGTIPVLNEDEDYVSTVVNTDRREELKELLMGLPKEEPVVIFAKFRCDFDAIKAVCEELDRGYSEISGVRDDEKEWQGGKTSIIAVQYASGSESIELTRAHYCIYYSLTYSLAQYLQSKKRIHRPSQTQSVTYYHLVAQMKKGKTIDEYIMEALKKKKEVVDYIVKNSTPE